MMEMLADAFKYPPEQIRPWPFSQRQWTKIDYLPENLLIRFFRSNQTIRPVALDVEADLHKPVADVAEIVSPWNIFLELLPSDSGLNVLPTFDKVSN